MMKRNKPLEFGSVTVNPGTRKATELPIAKLVTGTPVSIPVMIVHGRYPGPTVWVNGSIHGDEINGVEIIRRTLELLDAKTMRGTVLAVPIVNVHGFMNGDRYLPDRRDLNRSFPGSARGSLASRIAKLFMTEVVARSDVGIDLHTGSDHRTNLPQIRADLDDPKTRQLAHAFGAPVMMHASTRDGSLRQAATEAGATVLLYEGGEAWRFDEDAIRFGVHGIARVFGAIDLIDPVDIIPRANEPVESRSSRWVRASSSGIMQVAVRLGDNVVKGQVVGFLHDSLGKRLGQARAGHSGVVIGLSLDPLVNRGDAVVHIAQNGSNNGSSK